MMKYKVIEKEILEWLASQDFRDNTFQIVNVELAAIKRPGWTQVYSFDLRIMGGEGMENGFGVLRSDDRYGAPKIQVFNNEASRDRLLRKWSQGLIVRKHR